MLLMALAGAAVLALVCWAALRESGTTTADPQDAAGPRAGGPDDDRRPPARPLDGVLDAAPNELDDATVADADTEEALAAAAALWTVLTQER